MLNGFTEDEVDQVDYMHYVARQNPCQIFSSSRFISAKLSESFGSHKGRVQANPAQS